MSIEYDCIVIGGGPSGTFLSKLLSDKGFRTLIIEKRAEYTEKVCGGFVPYKALQILSRNGIDRNDISKKCGNSILVTDTNQLGKHEKIAYPQGKYGLGVYRQVFDRYLSKMAANSGVEILFSHCVALNQIEYDTGQERFNITLPDFSFSTKHLIIATGAMGLLPSKITLFQRKILRNRTFGISEIIRCTGEIPTDTLRFHCPSSDSHDYFWMIPLDKDTWNIGYWMEHPDKRIKELFYQYKDVLFDPICGNQTVICPLRGAYLGNVDLSSFYHPKAFVIGDAGGFNAQTTGEGIRFALQSALRVFERILDNE